MSMKCTIENVATEIVCDDLKRVKQEEDMKVTSQIVLWEDEEGNKLTEYTFSESMCDLITRCVQDVVPKLVINPKIKIFGKEGIQHRNVGLFSTNSAIKYGYSGFHCETQSASFNVEQLLQEINDIFPGANYNAILVNEYTSGDDYISDHSDDEKTLSQEAGVLTISYGCSRDFQVKRKEKKELMFSTPTRSHRMLQMFGATFQKKYLHGIPRVKKNKNKLFDPRKYSRVSLTFRSHEI